MVKAYTTYVRPLLEYCTVVWSLHHTGLVNRIESVQYNFTKTSRSAMAERQRELGDFKKVQVNGGTDNDSLLGFPQVSPLLLTDPHHMVIKPFVLLGLAAKDRSRRWM